MILPFYIPVYQTPDEAIARDELVVLLHGFLTTGLRLARIHRRMLKEGYDVLSITYPTRHFALRQVAAQVAKEIAKHFDGSRPFHIVGYSMGGIVARAYVDRDDAYRPETIVCLGTPNQGTEYVDGLLDNAYTRRLFEGLGGPPGVAMTTRGGIGAELGPVPEDIDLGVIAGDSGLQLWPELPGPHDTLVPVERTKVEGMTDHIVLPVNHIGMIFSREVIDQTVHFLEHHRFRHDPEQASAR